MSLLSPLARIGAAAQNALEVARFGGLETGEEPSPYEVVEPSSGSTACAATSRRPTARRRPPSLLVPPMMLAADVYDVSPRASAVARPARARRRPLGRRLRRARARGGRPGAHAHRPRPRGLATPSTACATTPAATCTSAATRQGGMFCYQAAAYRRSEGLASVDHVRRPVDTRGALPFGLPEELAVRGAGFLADHVLARYALPAWASRTGFRLLDPVKSLRQQLDFLLALHDREALLPRERQRRFLEARRLGRLAGPGARRLRAPVRRPQPHALGRLRHRRPARHARRHHAARPDLRRRGRRDRAAARACARSAAPPRAPRSTR